MGVGGRSKGGIVIGGQFFGDLNRLAARYRAADKTLRRRLAGRLRTVAKPFGQKVLHDGADEFPRRGGLSARMKAGRATASMSLGGSSPSVAISLSATTSTGQRMAVRAMDDQGLVRHPVFGRSGGTRKQWSWVAQRIRPHIFTDQFKQGAPMVREQVGEEIQQILDDIAKG